MESIPLVAHCIKRSMLIMPNDNCSKKRKCDGTNEEVIRRGCIAFFSTYRPEKPLHIYSCPVPLPYETATSKSDEVSMVDGETETFNYNGRAIPPGALKTIIKHCRPRRPLGSDPITEADVDSGRVSGLVFVSERTDGLETLHFAIRFNHIKVHVQVFNFAEAYSETFRGVRMEDSGCFAGDNYLIFVSTMEPRKERRQPWTAVYRTDLKTGSTQRLTPQGVSDLSPSVSPSGKQIAVASFQQKEGGWTGEIEDLHTDIWVMDVEQPFNRTLVVKNGGWPTWGSDNFIFFHRKVGAHWVVFRVDLSKGLTDQVTPDDIDAMTPAAIDEKNVAVATIRKPLNLKGGEKPTEGDQFRHIEIFEWDKPHEPTRLTYTINAMADHFNPFVIVDSNNGRMRIGYHRSHSAEEKEDLKSQVHIVQSPISDIGMCRASGAFPAFSKDGQKLAVVNNEFNVVYVYDSKNGKREVYKADGSKEVFAPVWDQNPEKDTLYICVGHSFHAEAEVEILAIDVSGPARESYERVQLTIGGFNNAFPSTNPQGTRLVYRSTRDWKNDEDPTRRSNKNLYIMENAQIGRDRVGGKITRLTNGPWTDTHCEWSPNGNWIVFSSTRHKPGYAPKDDNKLDPGYYSVFIVKADDPSVVVRVVSSGYDLAGHVNHPFFSPDGKSLVVVADLAGVSADPISMPVFLHSVRPYGDLFIIDIDQDDIYKNEDVHRFKRITHSRFENSLATWAKVTSAELIEKFERFELTHKDLAPYYCRYIKTTGDRKTGPSCMRYRRG